jgi:hypothetical protein
MAADTLLVIRLLHNAGVVAAMGLNTLKDWPVAFQTLKTRASAADPVAGRALRCPAQKLVGARERTGRDLRSNAQRAE